MNYYPFHVGDYTSHTAHLDPIEDLAYRRALDAYYLREGPLPADPAEVARLLRLRSHQAEVEAVLREFFELTPDGWRHARCDEEIEAMRAKQQKQRERANKRWRKPEQASGNADDQTNQDDGNAVEMPLHSRCSAEEMPMQCHVNAGEMQRHSHGNAGAMPPTPTPTPTPTPKEVIGTPTSLEEKRVRGVGEGGNAHRAERATRQPRAGQSQPPKPDDVDRQVWDDWIALRKAKRAPVTPTVLRQAESEAAKAGMTLEQFLRVWCVRGTQGLQADWLRPSDRVVPLRYGGFKSARQSLIEGAAAAIFEEAIHV